MPFRSSSTLELERARHAILAAVDSLAPNTRPAAVIAEAEQHARPHLVREAYWQLRASYKIIQEPSGQLSRSFR